MQITLYNECVCSPFPLPLLFPLLFFSSSCSSMSSASLIVAITFAAVIGVAVVWLAIYYLHQWVYRKCVELVQWLLILLHLHTQPEDYGREKGNIHMVGDMWLRPKRRPRARRYKNRERVRSRLDRERERSRERSRLERERERSRERSRLDREKERSRERGRLDRERERSRERERERSRDRERERNRKRSVSWNRHDIRRASHKENTGPRNVRQNVRVDMSPFHQQHANIDNPQRVEVSPVQQQRSKTHNPQRVEVAPVQEQRSRNNNPQRVEVAPVQEQRSRNNNPHRVEVAPVQHQRTRMDNPQRAARNVRFEPLDEQTSLPFPAPAVKKRASPLALPMQAATPSPYATLNPAYQQPHAEEYGYPYEPDIGEELYVENGERKRNVPNRDPRRTDFIHICDKYPPIVLEALERQEPSESSSESESSVSETESVEHIPREYIPRTVFQFPNDPYLANRLYNQGPTSHPRQSMEDDRRGGMDPARYAPYYVRANGWRGNVQRHPAPSNAPP
jgi:hypothetical protein